MSVTANLLKVFRVDQQLRGLKSRLNGAEKFLLEQERQLKDLDARMSAAEKELKGLKTSIAGDEGEAASIDARMAKLRDQMNNSKTNKEYSAFLAELNALKAKKDEIEKAELGEMEKLEALQARVTEFTGQRTERLSIVQRARADRDAKAAEIKDRVDELTAQRAELAKAVDPKDLRLLDEAIALHGEEAMVPVEEVNRRDHEWACTNCQMTLPVELVNAISVGKLVRCISCKSILFTEKDVVSKKAPKGDNEDVVKSRKKVAAKAAKNAGEEL